MSKWTAHVVRDINSMDYKVGVTFESVDGPMVVQSIRVAAKEVGEARKPDDWLYASSEENVREFLQAIVNAAADFGVMPETDRLQGEMAATKYHLEDMRQLVFRSLSGGE